MAGVTTLRNATLPGLPLTRSMFFFKKKNQKTFVVLDPGWVGQDCAR
jgi:hypothetical protein